MATAIGSCSRRADTVPRRSIDSERIGNQAINVTYRDQAGTVAENTFYRGDEHRLEIETVGRPWAFDGDSAMLRLVTEASPGNGVISIMWYASSGVRTPSPECGRSAL